MFQQVAHGLGKEERTDINSCQGGKLSIPSGNAEVEDNLLVE